VRLPRERIAHLKPVFANGDASNGRAEGEGVINLRH
jgi:hypothetical protein